ncbi:hypothetical protein RRG08_011073 [Elysia crispata]|uniref:Secreted protein n=1 Tax=Elysia crispata TaxID=231223 RepID=A0AAE1DC26_9GAST|nr:hypothetical protein RRG08_011073 [Elysia crispata]
MGTYWSAILVVFILGLESGLCAPRGGRQKGGRWRKNAQDEKPQGAVSGSSATLLCLDKLKYCRCGEMHRGEDGQGGRRERRRRNLKRAQAKSSSWF